MKADLYESEMRLLDRLKESGVDFDKADMYKVGLRVAEYASDIVREIVDNSKKIIGVEEK